MMTEDEARTKWCPMVRAAYGVRDRNTGDLYGYVAANKGLEMSRTAEAHCIASECMMWRWQTTPKYEGEQYTIETSATHGRCGLAR